MKENKKSTGFIISTASAVVSGIILMVIEPTRLFIIGMLSIFIKKAKYLFLFIWNYLISNHRINGFLLLLLICLSVLLTFLIVVALLEQRINKIRKTYIKDVFYNVNWRWNWNGGTITNLWCFCRNCDMEISYDDSSMNRYSHDTNPRIDLICDHCGRIVSSIPQNTKEYLIGVIEREIRRNVRIKEEEQKNKNIKKE